MLDEEFDEVFDEVFSGEILGYMMIFIICPSNSGSIESPFGNGVTASFLNVMFPVMFLKSKINSILDAIVAKYFSTTTVWGKKSLSILIS